MEQVFGVLYVANTCADAVLQLSWLMNMEDTVNVHICCQGDHLSGKPGDVRDFGYCQGNVRDYDASQGSVREFHNVWKVGTLILTFAHIDVTIPVFRLDDMILTLIKFFVKSLKFVLFKRLRYLITLHCEKHEFKCRELSGNFTMSGKWAPCVVIL
jgi:hypothetical protein